MAQPGALGEVRERRSASAALLGAKGAASRTITLAVENMNCGGCMRKVERALLEVPGVASARANLSARRATVVFEEPKRELRAACRRTEPRRFQRGGACSGSH